MMSKIKKLWNIFITWATPIWNAVWGWIKKAGKLLLRLFLVLLTIVSSIAFLTVPFLNNVLTNTVAQWIWFPATLVLAFFVIMYCKKEKTPSNEPPVIDFLGKWGAIVVAFSFLSVFVFNYYDIDFVWKWIIAGVVAVYAPCFFFSQLAFDLSHNQRSSDEKQKASLNTCKNIVLYWLFDLFYLSIVNDWLVPMFVVGIMALIIVAINLSDAFLNGAKSLRFFIALELVLSLVASVFLIYKIPNCTVQNIVLTISSALIGGILTLLGVAWTIKDTNDKRKEDLQRIESDRKEEDRKKNIPYLMLANEIATSNVASVAETKALDFTKEADIAKIQNDTYYVIKFDPFTVKNVSDSNVVLKGLFFNDRYHPFKHRTLVDKGGVCQIQVGINHWFAFPQKINTTKLLVQDILSNEYVVECQMYSRMDDKPQRDTAPNGLEYLVCSYIYTAVSLMLPGQKKEETTSE